jgi:hypothetical protein
MMSFCDDRWLKLSLADGESSGDEEKDKGFRGS